MPAEPGAAKIGGPAVGLVGSAARVQEVADNVIIQYGGSVNDANVDDLMGCPDIDGALVGGASLKADAFSRIINFKQ